MIPPSKNPATYTASSKGVTVRIAPSPTGAFHLGTARTALFNYLFAKRHNGTFCVRFEDTDTKRSEKKYEKEILDALTWLGIPPDKVVRQSDRKPLYKKYISALLASNKAYISREPSKENPKVLLDIVRFRNTKPTISFNDTLRGTIEIPIEELGDFVIARGIDDPLYNLAVVIDDAEMGITHVLRGDDHIINTPRQVALFEALELPLPSFTHIPLIHSPTGGKLSKRKDATAVLTYKERGYLPEALITALAFLGWHPRDEKPHYTLTELTQAFSLDELQKKEAIFDEKKLQRFHRTAMREVAEATLRGEIVPSILKRFPLRSRLFPRAIKGILYTVRERGFLLQEVREQLQLGEYDFYFKAPTYEPFLLLPPANGQDADSINEVEKGFIETEKLLTLLKPFKEWHEDSIRTALWEHAEKNGKSLILWPLRVALTGKEKSPDPFSVASAIGKRQTLLRIAYARSLFKHL